MTFQVLTGPRIAAGELLSGPLDCTAGDLMQIITPAAWTDASLTFQLSPDGVTWYDMFRLDGFELIVPEVVPNAAMIVPFDSARAVGWVRFRSGPRAAPVAQQSDRLFQTVINTYVAKPV